jgi:transcription initiation factor TFIIIB Brf1 subunit/transcription initiation factor TFIIB
VIDERSEWRNFGDKVKIVFVLFQCHALKLFSVILVISCLLDLQDGDTTDPSRVGGPTNHLLSDGGLSTVIGAPSKGVLNATLTRNLQRAHAQGSNPDQSLLKAFRHISKLCDALGMNKSCKDKANELFRDVWGKRGIKGKGTAAVCAAVTYIACRLLPRLTCSKGSPESRGLQS